MMKAECTVFEKRHHPWAVLIPRPGAPPWISIQFWFGQDKIFGVALVVPGL